jgi:hypothetical protein
MTFKYLNLGLIANPASPKEQLREGFQALLNDQFYNTTSIQSIYEELNFGSGQLTEVDVRINRAINSVNGEKLGDDFKQILFVDLDHSTGIGYKYYFDNNYWVVTFSEIIMSLGTSCMVRRCNEVLRWVGTDGTYYEEPCALEYKISRPRDSVGTENPVMPQGFLDCYAQLNEKTELISGNQRFLFGRPKNRICFKVFGTGVQNMLMQETMNDESSRLLTLTMGGNFVNKDTDDIVDGIADRYKDYRTFTSASTVGTYDIVTNPVNNSILESGSAVYNVQYYLGSVAQSGSFIFSVSGNNVPVANYSFSAIDGNNFYVINNAKWLNDKLDILCSGSSGSRILGIELKGAW